MTQPPDCTCGRVGSFATNLPHRHYPTLRMQAHEPHRGSDVEAWIKRYRDAYRTPEGSETYESNAIDNLLDDYRLRADEGRGLADDERD